ncbi:hypothetical protein TgHK011_003086 [Trichoderma gracile]|nr:hypothetical protein TgHK011_003086 [Trichoderma gracile]
MEQRNSQRNQETERSSTKRACASLGTELSDTPRISIPCSPGWRSSADDESELFEAMSSGVTGLQLAAGELPDSQPDVAVLITGISALSSSCFSSSPAWDMAGDGAALSSSPFLRATSTGRSLRMHLVVTGAQRPRRNYLDVIEPYIPYTMASANLAREPANDALASCVDDHGFRGSSRCIEVDSIRSAHHHLIAGGGAIGPEELPYRIISRSRPSSLEDGRLLSQSIDSSAQLWDAKRPE